MTERVKNIRELLNGLTVVELADIPVGGIAYDSRKVKPGFLFVAVRGFKTDGHDYLPQALQFGAVAAVVEQQFAELDFPQILVSDARKVLPVIAARFYAPELQEVALTGITGTNGKTTTSYLVRSILEAGGLPSGLIGTISYELGAASHVAWNTTPESVDLSRMIFEMYANGLRSAVLEVSSHALDLFRVEGLKFKAAVFTNLSHEHLDYHRDLENYFTAKKHLLDLRSVNGTAIVNIDDEFGKRLATECSGALLTFSSKSGADIFPVEWTSDVNGIRGILQTPRGQLNINSMLIGAFNLENIMAAAGTGIAMEVPLPAISEGISGLRGVPGRLQSFKLPNGATAVVDYSHTPDSLEKALKTLRYLKPEKLLVVFGCGGDRDRKKRPVMGQVAKQFADRVMVTSDNPRFEEPQQILDDILAGIDIDASVQVNLDRKQAIVETLKSTCSTDIVLIAGKGHEDYQDIKGTKYPFDDREIVKEWRP